MTEAQFDNQFRLIYNAPLLKRLTGGRGKSFPNAELNTKGDGTGTRVFAPCRLFRERGVDHANRG
jgi:hypothetical protein